MKWLIAFMCCLPGLALGQTTSKIKTHEQKVNGHTFTLPEGFTIELIAKSPLIDRPIAADFDERGVLYVTDSAGVNINVQEQLKSKPHKVMRLFDDNGDGVFDRSTTFVKNIMFPEGIAVYRGKVYIAAPPHLLVFEPSGPKDDAPGTPEKIWFDGQTLTGCANDLHGPYRGLDGHLYWCKGAFAKQTHTLNKDRPFVSSASHLFRLRPDGKGLDCVMTGGMDNPVDVAFNRTGDRFFTTTFFQHPGNGQRDGLIHAVYGGIYGKDHAPIYEKQHRWTSPQLMPVMSQMGPAAPSGLHAYQSDQFGPGYCDSLFACQFNLRKVSHHRLVREGASYRTIDQDFVVSDRQDFHPTDVIEDADGSLIIVDTGGWYKLCCPSSQLVKADVLGAIYRVRKTGAHQVADPRGLKIDWEKAEPKRLLALLDDARPAVVQRATERLGYLDQPIPKELQEALAKAKPEVKIRLLWVAAHRHQDEAYLPIIEAALGDPDPSVAYVGAQVTALHRYKKLAKKLAEVILATNDLHLRRMCAEALGRIGDAASSEALVNALSLPGHERVLDHSITYALIEIGLHDGLLKQRDSANEVVRRCVLTVIDQLGGKLEPKEVIDLLSSKNQALRDTARWIVTRHPEWSSELIAYFSQQIDAVNDGAGTIALGDLMIPFCKSSEIQALLAKKLDGPGRSTALALMIRAGVKELPESWVKGFVGLLKPNGADAPRALGALRTAPIPKGLVNDLNQTLLRFASQDERLEMRLQALATLPNPAIELDGKLFQELIKYLDRDGEPKPRGFATEVISRAKLSGSQLQDLMKALPKAGPMDVDRLLTPYGSQKEEALGLALVAALGDKELRPVLRIDRLKEVLKNFGQPVHEKAAQLYDALSADFKDQQKKLEAVLKSLPKGDVRRGQAVFNSTKTQCIACHTIGYVGGKIGPDLTKIGSIRSERDLLESILYPSISFVRSYEPVTIRTQSGKVFNGLPKKDAPDEIILITAVDQEVRIPRGDIEEIQPGRVSVMPAGLEKVLTQEDLADLIAFLRACR